LVFILRQSLKSRNPDVFARALDGLQLLSTCVGPALDSHLSALLVQVNRKSLFKGLETKINETIEILAENGGDRAVKIIKTKVPTFSMC